MARKEAEALCLEWISEIDKSGDNTRRWEAKFKDMNDEEFKAFVEDLRNNRDYISIIAPNLDKTRVSTENNFRVAKKYGVKLFQRIWLTDYSTGRRYLSNEVYPILHLPVRRQIQMARNKFSYAENNQSVDNLTGQPSGNSEAGSISYPETLVLYSRGLEKSIQELVWARGGNQGAFRAMNRQVIDTGQVTLRELEQNSTGVKSTKTLSTYLTAIHIQNNV